MVYIFSEMAFKDCNENGTWWVDPTSGAEWTNYSSCVPKDVSRYA
jgi:hypothetical protein